MSGAREDSRSTRRLQSGASAVWRRASEYIAARLNQATGVELPAATEAAFAEATGIFQARTPLQVQLALFQHVRIDNLAAALRHFNQGHTGPGTCP